MMVHEQFDDYAEWQTSELVSRLGDLVLQRDKVPSRTSPGPEHMQQLNRDIAHVEFELEYRVGEYTAPNI